MSHDNYREPERAASGYVEPSNMKEMSLVGHVEMSGCGSDIQEA